MEQLNICRGNVNMNIRQLIGWGLITRVIIHRERSEHFSRDRHTSETAADRIKERRIPPTKKDMDNKQGDYTWRKIRTL